MKLIIRKGIAILKINLDEDEQKKIKKFKKNPGNLSSNNFLLFLESPCCKFGRNKLK